MKNISDIRKKTEFITASSIIAALYVVLTLLSSVFGLASGAVQLRLSEALTVLPYFTPAAIPGLVIGCIISNILTGSIITDVIFGSLATLIGAVVTYLLRKSPPIFAPIPPIVANTLIIPPVLKVLFGMGAEYRILYLTVFSGEFLSCGVLGLLLLFALRDRADFLFGKRK